MLARRGIRLNLSRLNDAKRSLSSALDDPRPLHSRPIGVGQATRDLSRTLDHLDRWLAAHAGRA